MKKTIQVHFTLQDDFYCTSYFSNCFNNDKILNDFDLKLIKYHYSYGICKGTDLKTFTIQHENAKSILKKYNQLKQLKHVLD